MRKSLIILLLLIVSVTVYAQDTAINIRKLKVSGYVKEMGIFGFDKDIKGHIATNYVHNRINCKWATGKSISAAIEIRNRVYWGDAVRATADFANLLKNENEWLNLSALWINRNNVVFQSTIDRLWAEFNQPKWNVRLGRQRINWGLTTVWNPNDIFNTYNFLDFDYEERPGIDAISGRYQFSDSSALEVAVNPSGEINKSIAALRYCIDKWGYHLQMVGGVYQNKLTAGFGWTKKFGNVSYKGEGQAFIGEQDSTTRFNYSIELNFELKNNWNLSGSILHNTTGLSEPVSNTAKINFRLSPTNPMPGRWSFITTASKQFAHRLGSNLNLVYSPGIHLFIIYPSLQYNLTKNIHMDIVSQSFFLELQKKFQATTHNVFLRIKWLF